MIIMIIIIIIIIILFARSLTGDISTQTHFAGLSRSTVVFVWKGRPHFTTTDSESLCPSAATAKERSTLFRWKGRTPKSNGITESENAPSLPLLKDYDDDIKKFNFP